MTSWSIPSRSTRNLRAHSRPDRAVLKEPDGFILACYTTRPETGVAIEIAYRNENPKQLKEELELWVSGSGHRACMCIGVKIDDRGDRKDDPFLSLLVQHAIPGLEMPSFAVYPFGRHSAVMPSDDFGIRSSMYLTSGPGLGPALGDPNPAIANLDNFGPIINCDIVELPLGHALFGNIDLSKYPCAFSPPFIQFLQDFSLCIDLADLRGDIIDTFAVIQTRRSQAPSANAPES